MFEDIVELVAQANVAFPPAGLGLTESDISRAEAVLGVQLPPSYRWWLMRYGGGQIGGDILLGIGPHKDGPDLFTVRQRRAGRLYFYQGNEERFFFDTTHRTSDEEFPVMYEEDAADPSVFAATFADFLRRRIREICG